MIAALVYLQVHSLQNRVRSRLRRLKRPKYLAGAVAGGLYVYYFFLRQWITPGHHAAAARPFLPKELAPVIEDLAAMATLVVCLLAWVWPQKRAALGFTEAEVAFLFPAPVTRRTLVHYKLLKSQAAILFSACFMTLFSGRLARGGLAWTHFLGSWWLLLSTANLHFLGCSFAQTRLLDRGLSSRRIRFGILTVVVVILGATLAWAGRTITWPGAGAFTSLGAVAQYVGQVASAGPLPFVLYPFRLVVRPMLAANLGAFCQAAGPALVLLGLNYWWVIASDVAFEEASVEASRRLAERVAAVRAGKRPFAATRARRRRTPPFRLHPTGPRWIGLLWKNLIAAGQLSFRLWTTGLLVLLVAGLATKPMMMANGLAVAVGGLALGVGAMLLVIGPQVLRMDLRQDLPVADVLKAYPLHGWQVVLGEILAPALILTTLQWLLIVITAAFFEPGRGGPAFSLAHRAAFGVAIALVVPLLDLVSLLIQNAAVLVFPAWAQFGPGAQRGVEILGQRLIFMFGQVLAILLAVVPAALGSGVAFLTSQFLVGFTPAVVLAGVAAAVVLLIEVALGVWLLGGLFERFDLSAEQVDRN